MVIKLKRKLEIKLVIRTMKTDLLEEFALLAEFVELARYLNAEAT